MPELTSFWLWSLLACLACGLTLALSTWDTATTRRETVFLFLLGVAYATAWISTSQLVLSAIPQHRTTDSSHMSITTTKGEK